MKLKQNLLKKKRKLKLILKNLRKDDLIYDINAFLHKQNKKLSGINSKTKPVLLKIIKYLKITKHYTAAEKKQIAEINENERLKHFEL